MAAMHAVERVSDDLFKQHLFNVTHRMNSDAAQSRSMSMVRSLRAAMGLSGSIRPGR